MSIYETVQIDGKDYPAFASIDQADEYLAAEPGEDAEAWRALADGDAKARPLVGATRIMARQPFAPGVIADPLPAAIRDATILLAAAIANGYDAANQPTTASGIKRQKAGSVEQEFFYGAAGGANGTGYRFPLSIWELIRGLMGGGADASGIGGSIASGTCGSSIADIDYGYGVGGGGGYGYDSAQDSYDRAWE